MSDCTSCGAGANAFLCTGCTTSLANMLEALPDLIRELEVTRSRKDRLALNPVGHTADQPSPINVGAMRLAVEVEGLLFTWVTRLEETGLQFFPATSVGCNFIGPLLPGWRRLPRGYSGSPEQRARWLAHHVQAIAAHPKAADALADFKSLVGQPKSGDHTQPGRILRAIDRTTRLFAGPCPTIVGHNHEGREIACGYILFAIDDLPEVECPKCKAAGRQCQINVKDNRLKAAMDRDLLPEVRLREILEDLGEPVSHNKFSGWSMAGRIKPRAWLHRGQIVDHEVARGDTRLWSLSQVRSVRWQEEYAKAQASAVAS